MFLSTNVHSYIASDGSITFNLKTIFLFDVDCLPVFTDDQGNISECANHCCLENKFSRTLLENVASLLGDQETSDVTISVISHNGLEIGKFYCHSAILSGSWPAFDICTSLHVSKILVLFPRRLFNSLTSTKLCFPSNAQQQRDDRKEGWCREDGRRFCRRR